jgi:dihydrofolate synthase / folylpolyglutamate synthase
MGFHAQTIAVFGIMADKDIDAVITAMRPRVDRWMVATLPPPRGAEATMLRARLVSAGIDASAIETYDDPAEAYRAAREASAEADRIVVFGSFQTVAAALSPRSP